MFSKSIAALMVVAGGLTLGGCTMGKASTEAPVKKPAAADYQQALAPSTPPANLKVICYNPADLATVEARMLQTELSVAALQCQTAGGARAFEAMYSSFLNKFSGNNELQANARALRQVLSRKTRNQDVLVTEFANRTAQRAQTDREFCSRSQRALEWAMDPRATTLAQVPPPYNLGPEMNIHPCTAP